MRTGAHGFKRKIREAKLAEELENEHPAARGKRWILDKYLNNVPYGTVGGQTAVGVQAAARIFFDKPAEELTLARGRAAGRPAAGAVALQPVPEPGGGHGAPQRGAATRWPTRATDHPDAGRRPPIAAPLGVKAQRLLHRERESYFFDYVKQQLIDEYGVETRPQAAACTSTRRSTSRCRRAARKALDDSARRHRPRPARSSRSTRANGHIRAMASTAQLRRARSSTSPPRAATPAGLDVQGDGADGRAAPGRRPEQPRPTRRCR